MTFSKNSCGMSQRVLKRIKNFDRSLFVRLTNIADKISWFIVVYLIFIHHFVLKSNCRIYIYWTESNLNIISNTISDNCVCSWEKATLGGCHQRNIYQAEDIIYLATRSYTKVTSHTEISPYFPLVSGSDDT